MGVFINRTSGGGSVNWVSVVIAVALLLAIAAFGVYAAGQASLEAWATLMLHSFELVLGVVLGLIGGDVINRP